MIEDVVEAGEAGSGATVAFSLSLLGDPVVEDEETPWLFLRPFFPFLEDDDDVDMDEFRPCVVEPAAGVAVDDDDEFSPEFSFGDFDGEKASVWASSSLLSTAVALGRGLKAGIVLIAFLF